MHVLVLEPDAHVTAEQLIESQVVLAILSDGEVNIIKTPTAYSVEVVHAPKEGRS